MKPTIETEIHIITKGGVLFTTSLDVAEKFSKRHDHVLASIRKICADSEEIDAPKSKDVNAPKIGDSNFGRRNFSLSSYLDEKNERRPMFTMTRSGFAILAMGFTGKKALEWKIKYEQAFSLMEQTLLNQKNLSWQASRQQGKLSRRDETDTIADFVAYAKSQGSTKPEYYYKHLTNATYKALFIVTDKFPGSFRDLLNTAQLSFLATAEHVTAKALQDGMAQGLFYKDIYPLAKSRLEALAQTVGVSPVICQRKQLSIAEARA
jgi:Rha family phage regulatory protein